MVVVRISNNYSFLSAAAARYFFQRELGVTGERTPALQEQTPAIQGFAECDALWDAL